MDSSYTQGHASKLYSDWLKTYMNQYEIDREEREYKAPLGERNIGVLNGVLASANVIKNINDTIEANKLATGEYQVKEGDFFDETSLADLPLSMQPQAIFEKGKTALFGPGVEPIPETMKNGGKVKKYQEGDFINPLEFRKPESIMDQLTPVKTPEIKEITKGEALDMKLSPIAQKGQQAYGDVTGALGSIKTLEKSDSGVDKAVAIYDLAEKGERGVRAGIKGAKKIAEKLAKKKAAEEITKAATKEAGKAVAKEAVEGGAKSTLGKLAPGVGIGLGAHQIATAKNPLGKIGGAFDVAAGVTSFLPGLGTVASGILGGIGTGLSILGGVSEKPKGRRHIARW